MKLRRPSGTSRTNLHPVLQGLDPGTYRRRIITVQAVTREGKQAVQRLVRQYKEAEVLAGQGEVVDQQQQQGIVKGRLLLQQQKGKGALAVEAGFCATMALSHEPPVPPTIHSSSHSSSSSTAGRGSSSSSSSSTANIGGSSSSSSSSSTANINSSSSSSSSSSTANIGSSSSSSCSTANISSSSSSSSSSLTPLDLLDPELQSDPDLRFMLLLSQLQQWQQRYGHTVVPPRVYDKPELARWAHGLRQWYRQRGKGQQQQHGEGEGQSDKQHAAGSGAEEEPQHGLIQVVVQECGVDQQYNQQYDQQYNQQYNHDQHKQQGQGEEGGQEEGLWGQQQQQGLRDDHNQQQHRQRESMNVEQETSVNLGQPTEPLVSVDPVQEGASPGGAVLMHGDDADVVQLSAWQLKELQAGGFSWDPSQVGVDKRKS